MKIYTKTGDTGETGLYGGARIPKDSLRVEAIGTVDELNACIGYARSQIRDTEIDAVLERVQNELFDLGADLATLDEHAKADSLRIPSEMVHALEREIDRFQTELPPMTHFILPGGSAGGSVLHLARTVCRRSERCVVRLATTESINPEVLRYLNRLSDLLFVLARCVNHRLDEPEPMWQSPLERTKSQKQEVRE
ncbi:cob(I)yrinic acid a,c-diamide adenosyltransferase [Candidatus Poribacteria bacterium]|nr:cob(I)yrinic acid a,c-diamide adenosyltransferase [Candidatus Poribacteria bacterium]